MSSFVESHAPSIKSGAILCKKGDCLPPAAMVWVEGSENPIPLTSVEAGMRLLTVQHAAGNPLAFAPVQGISMTKPDEGTTPVWLRIELADGNEVVITANHCVLPNSSNG